MIREPLPVDADIVIWDKAKENYIQLVYKEDNCYLLTGGNKNAAIDTHTFNRMLLKFTKIVTILNEE